MEKAKWETVSCVYDELGNELNKVDTNGQKIFGIYQLPEKHRNDVMIVCCKQ